MKKKIFVTGSSGLVATRFIELQKNNFDITASEIDTLDITNKGAVRLFFKEQRFDTTVHFAAYTDVGKAEEQRGDKQGSCWKVNVAGTRNLVEAIDPTKTHFIYISTDMVFPGNKGDPGPYTENHGVKVDDEFLTWYGYSKAQAERIVIDTIGLDNATILRLIYPVRAKFKDKLDYLRKPLKLYDQGKLYPLFTDQQISVCFIDEVSTALQKIIGKKRKGIFHASSNDLTSPHEIVSYLIEKARGKTGQVAPSSIKDFLKKKDNPVRYPIFGGLKVDYIQGELKMKFSNWKTIVDSLVRQGIGE
jgi:dTDP-4-dehydrorhamnose reductase